MRKSPVSTMMVFDYLETNKVLGFGDGYTLRTWLKYNTHGRAKKYQGRYHYRMSNILLDLMMEGKVITGPSHRGRTAWYFAEQ